MSGTLDDSSIIRTIEQRFIAEIKTALTTTSGSLVRLVDVAPADWDEEFLKQVAANTPCVLVVFGGGFKDDSIQHGTVFKTQWEFVAVHSFSRRAMDAAHGNTRQIGCYQMLERIAPVLDSMDFAEHGEFVLESWNNDDAIKYQDIALMVQSLSGTLLVDLSEVLDDSTLDDFITFHDSFAVGQLSGAPTTEDTTTLEQD